MEISLRLTKPIKNLIIIILAFTFIYATTNTNNNNSIPNYWIKNLGTYYQIPKGWFFKKRFENNALSIYITKDKFDKNEQFKTGFSLHFIPHCKNNILQNPNKLAPSLNAKNLITNLSYHMNRTIVSKPYTFKDHQSIGYGATTKNNKYTMRIIALGDDKNDICLILMFEAPNEEWKNVEKIGNKIIESHWR